MDVKPETLVYLDSADYSQLAEAKTASPLCSMREDLISLSRNKTASFVYAGTHICEMAPLDPKWAHHAVRRTDLLSDLCGNNCLMSLDKVIDLELSRLRDRSHEKANVISRDGNWFPEVAGIMQALDGFKQQVSELMHEALAGMPQSRKLRRMLASKSRGGFKVPALDVKTVISEFAMRHSDAQILIDYIAGKRGRAAAERAFLASFRDPRWMMRWAEDHHASMSRFSAWQRGPAERLMLTMAPAIEAHQSLWRNQPSEIEGAMNEKFWQRISDETVVSVVQRLTADSPFHFTAADVDIYCPGIATSVRVLISSMRSSFSRNARKPKASDFVDAVHAAHAPYVTIFRTDSYMAPLVKKHVLIYGTVVAQKLTDLPEYIWSAVEQPKTQDRLR